MKCPYNGFKNCIVEQCPSCNYEKIEKKTINGRYPHYMGVDVAINRGLAWESVRTTYKFVSCKLVDSGVQPVPQKKELTNNTTSTNVVVKRSIF